MNGHNAALLCLASIGVIYSGFFIVGGHNGLTRFVGFLTLRETAGFLAWGLMS